MLLTCGERLNTERLNTRIHHPDSYIALINTGSTTRDLPDSTTATTDHVITTDNSPITATVTAAITIGDNPTPQPVPNEGDQDPYIGLGVLAGTLSIGIVVLSVAVVVLAKKICSGRRNNRRQCPAVQDLHAVNDNAENEDQVILIDLERNQNS